MSLVLECRVLSPDLLQQVTRFFARLASVGADRVFHPHPLTPNEAERRVHYVGEDIYLALLWDREMIGYGMLRGWDEGFQIPSLGIAIDPAAQGLGYGRLLMELLHANARKRGAKQVRLKVHTDNTRAIQLYQSLGYVFSAEQDNQLIGHLTFDLQS